MPCIICLLRCPESLDAGSGTSKKIPLYHVPIIKQALALNRGKTLVAHRTLKSIGKYLEMWKFRYFKKIQFFSKDQNGALVFAKLTKVQLVKNISMCRGNIVASY